MNKIGLMLKKNKLNEFCYSNGIELTEFNPNSFRLKKEGYVTINYFPKSNRVFFYDVEEWGDVTDMIQFLNYNYKSPD